MAKERDQATFRVLSNQAMIALSLRPPAERGRAGGRERHLRRAWPTAAGATSWRPCSAGQAVPEAELPALPAPAALGAGPGGGGRAPSGCAARATASPSELDLDPGFLMSRAVLDEIARRNPAQPGELREVPEVRRWQVEALGDELLASLHARLTRAHKEDADGQ